MIASVGGLGLSAATRLMSPRLMPELVTCTLSSSPSELLNRHPTACRSLLSTDHHTQKNIVFPQLYFYLSFLSISRLLLCKEQLLITGDFNIHVDDLQDSCARKFLEVFDCVGLKQHVDQPTHREGHTLDLTITLVSESLIVSTPVVDHFTSDHAAVLC